MAAAHHGPNLKTRIGWSTQRYNPVSALIRSMTGAQCSHVWWIYYDLDFGIDMVMDAHETGYRLIPFTTFQKRNKIVAIIQPKHDVDDALLFSVQWLGTMYDFAGLLGAAWVQVGRFLRRQWKNPFRSKSNVYCSEAVARGLISQSYPNLTVDDPEVVTPDQLLKFYEAETGGTHGTGTT
jgi:hypothetical protein